MSLNMGRWKPAPEKSSPHITAAGFARLQQESRDLWKRRAEVTKALTAAAAEGDRSENAEYIYRKKELREIDRRIHYLQKRIPKLQVVDSAPSNPKQVYFGAWVTLEKDHREEVVYRIVGADEFDPQQGYISLDSPLARALLKKTLDDEVTVETPLGTSQYCVLAVRYAD
jgi:transcription elongation factor GreB